MTTMRGIRGAIQARANTIQDIKEATQELLREMMRVNTFTADHVISAFFTMTVDLNADFPAAAARSMGWEYVPLLDAQELEVPGGMERVIRVLLHVETGLSQKQVQHVYIGSTETLRPDIKDRD